MIAENTQAHIKLHIAVLLFGYTAIFGELISLDAGALVWYRMLIASIGFLFIPKLYRSLKQLPKKVILQISATGLLVMLHWVTFFAAIKLSNVSITLCFIATQSFFTSLIEPLLFKRRPDPKEIGLALLILPGIYMVFTFTDGYFWGIFSALVSASLAALFSSINKKFVTKAPSICVSFLELSTGWFGLTLLLPLYFWLVPNASLHITDASDVYNLLLLALLCTTIAYRLAVDALKHVSAFTSALAINLEPIYGIILAALYFDEHKELDSGFYWGASLIVLAVFINGWLKWRLRKKQNLEVLNNT